MASRGFLSRSARFASTIFAVGLRLRLSFGGQAGHQSCAPDRRRPTSCQRARGCESDARLVAVRQRLLNRRDGGLIASAQQFQISEHGELPSRSIGAHGRQVGCGALREDSRCVLKPTFIYRQLAQSASASDAHRPPTFRELHDTSRRRFLQQALSLLGSPQREQAPSAIAALLENDARLAFSHLEFARQARIERRG